MMKLYLLFGLAGVGGYGYVNHSGWEYTSQKTRFVPKTVMGSPGGYRSFHYWHVGYGGYRGGK